MTKVRHNPAKWANRAAAADQDYLAGVRNPRRSWEDSTANAEENYSAGVQEAISDGRFGAGVRKAGDEKWKKGVEEKGRTRYRQGVAVAENEYDKGFKPFADVIERTTLPPRGPKGQNYGRVEAIGEALREAKRNQ